MTSGRLPRSQFVLEGKNLGLQETFSFLHKYLTVDAQAILSQGAYVPGVCKSTWGKLYQFFSVYFRCGIHPERPETKLTEGQSCQNIFW